MTAGPETSLGPGSEGLVPRKGRCSLEGSPGTNTEQRVSRGGDRQVGQDHGCLLWVTLSQINTHLHAQFPTWQQRHPAASHTSHLSRLCPGTPRGSLPSLSHPRCLGKQTPDLPSPSVPSLTGCPACVLSPRGSSGELCQGCLGQTRVHSKHRSINVPPAHCPMAEVSRAHASGRTWKVTLVLTGQWGQGAGSPAL